MNNPGNNLDGVDGGTWVPPARSTEYLPRGITLEILDSSSVASQTMKMRTMKWITVAAMLAGVMAAQAAPWLGLVKTGTSSQTNDTIAVGTPLFSMDLRANTDTHKVYALQYSVGTSAGSVTYGAASLTALNNPFVQVDLTNSNATLPAAGSAVNHSNWTVWWTSTSADVAAFPEQSIGTYQFNVSSLGAGTYVFSLANEEMLNNDPGEDITTFAASGAFVLGVTAVPEPGAGTLLACGGLVAAWRNRRRNAR